MINLYNNKLSEYKGKIQQLKIKINELYKEKQEQSKKIDSLNEENQKYLKKQINKNNKVNKFYSTKTMLKKNIYNPLINMNKYINEMNINSKSVTEPNKIPLKIMDNEKNITKIYNDTKNNGNNINNDSDYISQNKILNDFKNILNKVETLQKNDNSRLNKDDDL